MNAENPYTADRPYVPLPVRLVNGLARRTSPVFDRLAALQSDDLLEADRFRDYCPNGLQVEGNDQVSKIVSGVTASQALIDAAIDAQADALLVHHGYFW